MSKNLDTKIRETKELERERFALEQNVAVLIIIAD